MGGCGAGGQQRSPRLGGLAEVALLQVGEVRRELVREARASRNLRGERLETLRGEKLARRQQCCAIEPTPAPLGHGVEGAQRLELVAEQLDTQRLRGARRPHVDQPAPIRELADAAHLDDRLVASPHQCGE